MQITVVISQNQDAPGTESIEDKLAELCASEPGLSVVTVPHIYHIPETDPIWQDLASLDGHIILITHLYPRPAEWLFRKHWPGNTITALNLTDYADTESCHAAITHIVSPLPGERARVRACSSCEEMSPQISPSPIHNSKLIIHDSPFPSRWYPVIDRSRCRNCGNCLQFCLFGVYETGEGGQVTVCQPDRCKPGCPACSRICPEGAIMFPLYTQSPAIAGAPGLYMSPDAAARRMFYARTKQVCPVCGSTEENKVEAPGAEVCDECGRPIAPATSEPGLRDEIDQLIDDLDDLMGGK